MTRQLWIADKLRAYGLTVVEVTGWQDRARPGAFDPVGVIVHHTAAPQGKPAPSLQVCIDGRTGLAGPLCNVLLARNCTCYVISAGRCNHAGQGSWRGIEDGNGKFLAIEAENDGIGEPWSPDLLIAFQRATAALIDGLGRDGYAIGHKEWAPGRKIDPNGIDMAWFRTHATIALANHQPKEWQQMLLDNGAPIGNKDGRFGRLTPEHSRKVLDHRNQLLAQVAELTKVDAMRAEALRTSADTIKRLTVERDAAKAEQGRLGQQLQEAHAEIARLQALADVATRGPALLAIVQGLRAQLNEAEAKLQGLA